MKIYRDFFGKKLQDAIDEKHIKQFELAAMVGVQPQSVSRWCTGAVFPEEPTFELICKALKMSPEEFLPECPIENLVTFLEAFQKATPAQRQAALLSLSAGVSSKPSSEQYRKGSHK